MGANQSNIVNDTVNETVSNFLSQNTTSIKQDIVLDTKTKQEMYNKIKLLDLNNCKWEMNINTAIITRTNVETDINVSTSQATDLLRKIQTALDNEISQEMKGLPLGGNNKSTVQNSIDNITKTNIQNIVNSIYQNSMKQLNTSNEKMTNDIEIVKCNNSTAVFHMGISLDSSIKQASTMISTSIQTIKEVEDISNTIKNKVKQKMVGFDLTMVAIVAVIAFLIYMMAESGTLGQLMPGGGGKGKSSPGFSSLTRNPVTSRSSLLGKAEKVLHSAFGGKAWWL